MYSSANKLENFNRPTSGKSIKPIVTVSKYPVTKCEPNHKLVLENRDVSIGRNADAAFFW